MNDLRLETEGDRRAFAPGEVLRGIASWQLESPPKRVEVRLLWFTTGKGTMDVGVVDTVAFDQPAQLDSQIFEFTLPNGPYAFAGSLITLQWAIELVPVGVKVKDPPRVELVVAPGGQRITLGEPEGEAFPKPALRMGK